MIKKIAGIAAFLGVICIALGAFGAHSLKNKIAAADLLNFETGVRYMMYHVLAILIMTNSSLLQDRSKLIVSYVFLIGILFFSGSLIAISTGLISAKQIWYITPLGGLFFMTGWLIAGVSYFKTSFKN